MREYARFEAEPLLLSADFRCLADADKNISCDADTAADVSSVPVADAAVKAECGRVKVSENRLGRRAWFLGCFLALAVIGIMLISGGLGQFYIAMPDILSNLWHHVIGVAPHGNTERFADAALWNVRFPRIALALFVGMALGVGGSLTQSLFANPLAEPSVIGVSSGASFGAAVAIVFLQASLGIFTTPFVAFLAAVVTTAVVWWIANGINAQRAVSLLLVGIAVNALVGALTALMFFVAPTTARDTIVFWQMGSLNAASWGAVGLVAVPVCVAFVVAVFLTKQLDALALGDTTASSVGVNVRRLRIVTIVCVALLTGSAVAFAGVIGFVGLIVPHVLRLIVGPAQRRLVPLSALGGMVLLELADLGARTLVANADMPVGMLTALIGAPTFLVLLRRTIGRGKEGK